MEIKYPSVDDIIKANKKVIEMYRVSKAEKHKLARSKKSLETMLEEIRRTDCDILKKAAMLLHEINRWHFFESANKRTSFIIAADFLMANRGNIPLKKKDDVKFLIEIREGKRTIEEIERWLNE